jgi:hypothetical protein
MGFLTDQNRKQYLFFNITGSKCHGIKKSGFPPGSPLRLFFLFLFCISGVQRIQDFLCNVMRIITDQNSG